MRNELEKMAYVREANAEQQKKIYSLLEKVEALLKKEKASLGLIMNVMGNHLGQAAAAFEEPEAALEYVIELIRRAYKARLELDGGECK